MGFFSGVWDALKDFFTGGASGGSDVTGPINRLYVGNLSYKVKEEELRALFLKYGRVKTLHLIRDKLTRRLKGYAFLEMPPDDAQKALVLNGVEFLGRKLVVSSAKSKQRSPEQQPSPQRPTQQRRPRSSSSQPKWRNKRRSGPRAYGQDANNTTPIERLE